MDDENVLGEISRLVDEERELRGQVEGAPDGDPRHRRLHEVEAHLDQCWDLLRQRRARQEFGQDTDDVAVRSVEQVEKYLQ